MNVLIIDSGSGNLSAIENILRRLRIDYLTSSDPKTLRDFSHLILPGVGSFDSVMSSIMEKKLFDPIKEAVENDNSKLLGICVGMQILANKSEEGNLPGLDLIGGEVKKFNRNNTKVLPHMGWNNIIPVRENYILSGIDLYQGFYFLHSYYFEPYQEVSIIANSDYGIEFSCIIKNKNIIGVQFHPEKSHLNGIKIFENFLELS